MNQHLKKPLNSFFEGFISSLVSPETLNCEPNSELWLIFKPIGPKYNKIFFEENYSTGNFFGIALKILSFPKF
jgi:hypothetical protein